MGIIRIGKSEYEANSFSLYGDRVVIGDYEISIDSLGDIVQLKGKDVTIKKLITNSNTIIEGSVGKSFSKKDLCAVGRVLTSYSYANCRYFNGTAKSELDKIKKYFSSKVKCQDKVIIKFEGDFEKVYTNGYIEISMKGKVDDVFCSKDLFLKGTVRSAVCEGTLYISK